MPTRQLVLDLPHRVALGREDFLVGPSNEAAVALIDRWPNWPSNTVILTGPAGSGKSHLVEVWRQTSGAHRADQTALTRDAVPQLIAGGNLALEDLPGEALDETALFHLLNLARQTEARLLITATLNPVHWPVRLPDLASRLRALPVVTLGVPDDSLLRGVLAKLFADRQLAVDDAVLSYLLARMPRSLEAARRITAEIDARALTERSEINRAFVARVLGDFHAPDLFGDD